MKRVAVVTLVLAACTRPADPSRSGSTAASDEPVACAVARAPAARVRTVVVSENARGMMTAVRWARSPNGCALLVVEDPVGVELEPVPDAVLYVASTAAGGVRVIRIDSVWDVAPDRAWTRLAVGRAFVARAGQADSILDTAWAALARAAGRPERDVREAAFEASGMTDAVTVARPEVWQVSRADSAAGPGGDVAALPLLAGWRVRWAPDGRALLVGSGPPRVGDDEPPGAWLRVDAATGRPLGAAPAPPTVPPAAAWQEAPLLDRSTAVDLAASRTIAVTDGRVAGRAGTVTRVDSAGRATTLGPGVPLAATADGRAVLAVAPRPGRVADHQVKWRVVIYVVE